MADDVRLVHLGQRRRRRPTRLGRHAVEGVLGRVWDLAAAPAGTASLEEGRLELLAGDAHRAAPIAVDRSPAPVSTPTEGRPVRTSPRAATKRVMSPDVVSSVVHSS